MAKEGVEQLLVQTVKRYKEKENWEARWVNRLPIQDIHHWCQSVNSHSLFPIQVSKSQVAIFGHRAGGTY